MVSSPKLNESCTLRVKTPIYDYIMSQRAVVRVPPVLQRERTLQDEVSIDGIAARKCEACEGGGEH